MSQFLDDEEDFDDDFDDDDDDEDDDDEDDEVKPAPKPPIKPTVRCESKAKARAVPQSKLQQECPQLESFAESLRGDALLRALESRKAVDFRVHGSPVRVTVAKLYPSVAHHHLRIVAASPEHQRVADALLARHTKQRPVYLSVVLSALAELASTTVVPAADTASTVDDAPAAPAVAAAPAVEEEEILIDFFEAKQRGVALSLEQAVAVTVTTLLDGKQKKLDKWLQQRMMRTESGGGRRGGRSDPTAGGFDERFSWMLMDLLDAGHETRQLHARFEDPLQPIAQYANVIADGVFLGPLHAAQDEKFLQRARIGAIVSVGDFTPLFAHKIEYLECVVRDRANEAMRPVIDRCVAFIAEKRAAGVPVLIHCLGGRSRSVTIATAYLMRHHQMSLARALGAVVRARPIASPNLGFLRTLRSLDD